MEINPAYDDSSPWIGLVSIVSTITANSNTYVAIVDFVPTHSAKGSVTVNPECFCFKVCNTTQETSPVFDWSDFSFLVGF